MENLFGLDEKVCMITGGTSGLGQAMSLAFADAGATVAVGSTNPEKVASAAREMGEGHSGLELDVSDEESVRAAVKKVTEDHGRLDVLVSAAGINQRVPLVDTTLEDWERVLRVNLTGTFLACREAGRVMLTQEPRENGERGCILNIASIHSFVALAETAAYGASKAAVAHLTKSLANDWSEHGIRANAIAPGVFPTDISRPLIEGTPRGDAIIEHTPMRRFGKTGEIVGAAVYLCSDAASFVTGEVLTVDGGFLARGVGQ